ncbi:hypothetical protein [Vreelandella salicampi]|uniref:Uncharacterized protein n=1 Tax=Vreelandella salicampi TaxID=1449798 RepID=A0A7Z0LMY4_9GAMM|nr:hypothetical protein [Halomonas salicampi]NYS61906.1 hypothetical protein [Halomonas salicampi]
MAAGALWMPIAMLAQASPASQSEQPLAHDDSRALEGQARGVVLQASRQAEQRQAEEKRGWLAAQERRLQAAPPAEGRLNGIIVPEDNGRDPGR